MLYNIMCAFFKAETARKGQQSVIIPLAHMAATTPMFTHEALLIYTCDAAFLSLKLLDAGRKHHEL